MCGILGMIGERWAADFEPALDCMAHRGPDDRGVWDQPDRHVRLGHRRLSIIDLSGAGHQPMTTADGRHTIIFNGEIYNFPELREQLIGLGCHFRSHCDTEVLLQAHAQWGLDALRRLDGMFAFAIWDREERKLIAARDRFGIKPLFYSTADGLIVSSTMSPYWQLTGFPRNVDYRGLRDYLASQSVPAPRTILRQVHAVEPGQSLVYHADDGRVELDHYWTIPEPTNSPMSLADLVEATDAAMQASVSKQMISDVPLGAFLSGGIDSSLLVAYMAEASSQPLKTFSVRFPETRGYDESAYAKQVADAFGCVHHVLDAEAIDADRLAAGIDMLDQPLADPAYLAAKNLSQLCRDHVTVATSGEGGDEVFGGYPRFLQDESHWSNGPGRRLLHRLIESGAAPGNLWRRALGGRQRLLWDRVKVGPWPGSRKALADLLRPDAADAAGVDQTMDKWRGLLDRFGPTADTDALMRADLWTYLTDNNLTKADRASMAFGLEVRVPMLGNDVVDLVLPQPAEAKLDGRLKAVLQELSNRRLPREVWDRPKHGFSVPVRDYFRGQWREAGEAAVATAPRVAPFLDARAVRRVWQAGLRGRADARLVYTLVVLLRWLQTHPVEA